MSVYKPKGRDTYYYDFVVQGQRFSGNTEKTNRREAEGVQESVRKQIRAELDKGRRTPASRMTWAQASDRYWNEVGRFLKGGGERHTLRSLQWLTKHIRGATRIIDIKSSTVADLVARRRGEVVRLDDEGEPVLVKPATVNRTVTEVVRKVIYRARDVWEEPVSPIKWAALLLPEPVERVRELSEDEEARLFMALRPDYQPIALFALASGVRLAGCLKLTWQDIDWGNRKIAIKGKGGKDYSIPLSKEMRAILWPLQGKHPEHVFTYVSQRTKDERRRGQRLPITESGLMSEWRRAREAADLVNYRWHDHRHTKATRLLRSSGNLKLVQRLLGHTRIDTTSRYAHVTDDDLLQALDEKPQQKSHFDDIVKDNSADEAKG